MSMTPPPPPPPPPEIAVPDVFSAPPPPPPPPPTNISRTHSQAASFVQVAAVPLVHLSTSPLAIVTDGTHAASTRAATACRTCRYRATTATSPATRKTTIPTSPSSHIIPAASRPATARRQF